MKHKCHRSGAVLAEMEYANFTRVELSRCTPALEAEKCSACGSVRKPVWVKRSLGGRDSGCWQWSLIFPYHNSVKEEQ